MAYLPGPAAVAKIAGLFRADVKLTVGGAAAAAAAAGTVIGETELPETLLLKRKVADKLGFTKEIQNVSKLASALGGKIVVAGDGKIADNGTPDGVGKRMVARWVAIHNAAIDSVNTFNEEYLSLVHDGATLEDSYKSAFSLAKSYADAKIHRINLNNPVNVVADLERGVGKKLSSMVP